MELLKLDEIKSIVEPYGYSKVIDWSVENYSKNLIGYLGDHLRLTINVQKKGVTSKLNFFVKCMPRFDTLKADYLRELLFFKKEYIMLSQLFKQFAEREDSQWRPKLLLVKEELFVFEDVAQVGYAMPSHLTMMAYKEIMATVQTIAKFHAASYIYEERKSVELNRPYRIWEEYSDYLQEPDKGQSWRNTGQNAVIAFLKVYSTHKNKPNFEKSLEVVIPMLFEGALTLMKPSPVYRNVVIHRDLWTNNIFLKKLDNGQLHALIVDFQTVLYSSPMLDLSSFIFFNTTQDFRNLIINDLLDLYYNVLSDELKLNNLTIESFFSKSDLKKAYEESIMFGITQAAIIVPIIFMSSERRKELFSNPENGMKMNVVSRSEEFIQIAREDERYRLRVTKLFDEIVDRYIFNQANT